MRKLAFILALFVIFSGLTPTAAQDQTLTVLCTPQEDWCVAITQAFQEATGIQTSYVRLSSGEALARIRASASDPEFSVWWGGPADAYIAAAGEGLLESYVSPNAADLDARYVGENNQWYGVYVGAIGFCSNTEMLKELNVEVPDSWEDLLNPALKGQVAMAHPATSGTAFTSFWTVITLEADKLEYPNGKTEGATGTGDGYDDKGVPTQQAIDNAFAYFTKLNNNILQYTRSGSAPGQMAGRGEIAVSIIFSHDCVKYQVEGFEGILQTSFPSEGTGFEIGGVGVITGGAETEAAKKFLDFALSVEGQSTAQKVNSFQIPTNPNTPVPELAVDLSQLTLVDYNFIAAGSLRTALVERFDTEVAPQPTE
ncbi:MAG: ABC transporter substrate-binding protein [Anaerolineae bacterium]|nr:ABC transporter substrate-binding protein [Anaerolineae bacterium]